MVSHKTAIKWPARAAVTSRLNWERVCIQACSWGYRQVTDIGSFPRGLLNGAATYMAAGLCQSE